MDGVSGAGFKVIMLMSEIQNKQIKAMIMNTRQIDAKGVCQLLI